MLENFPISHLVVILVLIFFSALTFSKKLLSFGGILFANVIGIVTYMLGGLAPFLTLVVFYVIAEAATWIAGKKERKHEQRTSSNIFGNCIAAIAALFFGQQLAFFGAISAAFADTISSEIGLLSKKKPVLITTFKEVEKGTDGAVSALGLAASLVAAAIIGGVHYFLYDPTLHAFGIIVVAGFLGGIVDSIFGATLQRRGLISNTQVNFLASITGAVIAIVLGSFF